MDWTDDDQQPIRTREELLAHVEQRGNGLRRRRRAGRALAGIAAVLAVAALGSLATIDDGEDGAVQVATDGPSGATGPETLSEPSPVAPWPMPPPEPIPLPAPPLLPEAPPTFHPGPITIPAMPTTTSASPAPTTPTTPTTRGSATTSTSGPRGRRCGSAELAVTAFSSKAEYRPGEKVVVYSTVSNRSATPCSHNSYNFWFGFTAPDGRGLMGGDKHVDGFDQQTTLDPGQGMTEIADWNQNDCSGTPVTCVQAAPGTYTAKVSWSLEGPTVEATTSFRLVP